MKSDSENKANKGNLCYNSVWLLQYHLEVMFTMCFSWKDWETWQFFPWPVVVWPYAHNRLKKMRESTCRKNPGIKIRHCCLVHCKSLTANMIEFSCNWLVISNWWKKVGVLVWNFVFTSEPYTFTGNNIFWVVNLCVSQSYCTVVNLTSLPGGILPYIGYTGICMCYWKGYGFQAIWSGIGST